MLLVNASNLYVGGGVQVGVSVIEEFTEAGIEFIAAVSPAVFEQLSSSAKKRSQVIKKTPSGLFNFSSRLQMDHLITSLHVTEVFTIFGPSYWNPKVKNHLVGFALPWLIYESSYIFSKLSCKEKIKKIILSFLQPFYFKLNATSIVCETRDVSDRVVKLLNFSPSNVHTVSNTISSVFTDTNKYDYQVLNKLPSKGEDIWLLTISHDYPHKNIAIIKELLELLPEYYKFVLTVGNEFKNNIEERHHNRLIVLGKVSSAECPPLYEICDALFLPTLLECFSASYVEAMYMAKPIFTSNRGFAKTVCGNSAYYFDPLNAFDIAKTILQAYNEPLVMKNISSAGRSIVANMPSAAERARKYLSIIYANKMSK
ncbi:glycosyltransferase family 4 protein [Erwinia sp. V71]|uniref:glycosyltransferase family 4 protein n=1 Tax=Erwinia sp. V71 TaxID=3369424 RepID=UPI003F61B34A